MDYLILVIDGLTDWLSDWLIDWLIDGLTDWLSDWLIDWLIDGLTDWLSDWLIDWLIDWWTNWLIDWWTNWLIDWLIDCLIDLLIDWLIDWLLAGHGLNRHPAVTENYLFYNLQKCNNKNMLCSLNSPARSPLSQPLLLFKVRNCFLENPHHRPKFFFFWNNHFLDFVVYKHKPLASSLSVLFCLCLEGYMYV